MPGMVVVSSADMPTICGLCSWTAVDELFGGHVGAQVDNLEPGALQHHGDEVLANVVQVTLDGADDDLAGRFRARLGQ